MKKGMVFAVAAAGVVAWGTSVFADPPKIAPMAPAAKLLLPKPGTVINNPSIARAPSMPAALPQGEKTSLIAAISAAKPSSLQSPPRSPFVATPADLKVGAIETRLMLAEWVYPTFADFGNTGGSFVISGMADGAWFVDCSISTQTGTAFNVQSDSKNSAKASVGGASLSTTANNGHLTFGLYFNAGAGGENSLIIARPDRYSWHRCEFAPIQ